VTQARNHSNLGGTTVPQDLLSGFV